MKAEWPKCFEYNISLYFGTFYSLFIVCVPQRQSRVFTILKKRLFFFGGGGDREYALSNCSFFGNFTLWWKTHSLGRDFDS